MIKKTRDRSIHPSVLLSIHPNELFTVQKVLKQSITSLCPHISLEILHFGTSCANELERNQNCIRVQCTFNSHFASRSVEVKLFTELYNWTTAGVRISQSPGRLFFGDCVTFFFLYNCCSFLTYKMCGNAHSPSKKRQVEGVSEQLCVLSTKLAS